MEPKKVSFLVALSLTFSRSLGCSWSLGSPVSMPQEFQYEVSRAFPGACFYDSVREDSAEFEEEDRQVSSSVPVSTLLEGALCLPVFVPNSELGKLELARLKLSSQIYSWKVDSDRNRFEFSKIILALFKYFFGKPKDAIQYFILAQILSPNLRLKHGLSPSTTPSGEPRRRFLSPNGIPTMVSTSSTVDTCTCMIAGETWAE